MKRPGEWLHTRRVKFESASLTPLKLNGSAVLFQGKVCGFESHLGHFCRPNRGGPLCAPTPIIQLYTAAEK